MPYFGKHFDKHFGKHFKRAGRGGARIREAVAAALNDDAAVSVLATGGVYPGVIPDHAAGPAVAYQLISTTRERGLSGPNGIARALFQVSIARGRGTDGQSLAAAVRDMFDGFRGALHGVVVIETIIRDERDLDDPPRVAGSGEPAKRTVLDVVFRYREPRPSR